MSMSFDHYNASLTYLYRVFIMQIMNNAGFDWRMYKGAMESPLVDQSSLAANGILSTVQNSWQQVTKYNFLKFTVPDALKPYVTITPSTHMNGKLVHVDIIIHVFN